jgi:hypothetical protein
MYGQSAEPVARDATACPLECLGHVHVHCQLEHAHVLKKGSHMLATPTSVEVLALHHVQYISMHAAIVFSVFAMQFRFAEGACLWQHELKGKRVFQRLGEFTRLKADFGARGATIQAGISPLHQGRKRLESSA